MSGGKGGSSTSSVQIPEYIETAAQNNLNMAQDVSQIGFVPQYGPSVAAFTPMTNASFDNTANAASAFGMTTPTAGSSAAYGGMGPATDYGNGVMGYSAKPIYDNMMSEFAADRPGQYDYINSFFIDPVTGAPGANAQPQTDYTSLLTAGDAVSAQQANDLAIAQAQAGAGPQSVTNLNLTQNELDNYENIIGGSTYNSQTDILTPEQQTQILNYQAPALDGNVNTNEYANDPGIAQDTVNMAILGNANNNLSDAFTQLAGGEPSFENPSSSGSYGGSLVTGELSTDLTGIPGLPGEIIDNVYSSVDFEGATAAQGENFAQNAGSVQLDDGSYDISSWFSGDDSNSSTSTNSTTTPASSSDSFFSGGGADGVGEFGAVGDFFGSIGDALGITDYAGEAEALAARPADATATSATSTSNDSDDDGGGGGGGGGGCVIATHAVASGAYTHQTKREAVVWCMHNLHDKWWGEAIRRGYRHLGRRKIEQGKAHNHYSEFRDYIDFATGKKRTLKGALHFAARSVQFFVVGLVKGDA